MELLLGRGQGGAGGVARARQGQHGGVRVLRSSFGVGILVISGPGRSMYQGLEPKVGGSNLIQEVKPQGSYRTPHDTTDSQCRKNSAEGNIQGVTTERGESWRIKKIGAD